MTSSHIDEDQLDLMQMFDKVVWEHGVIVSDERGDLKVVDHNKFTVMPRNIKSSDFHHGYKAYQTKTSKKKKYTTLLRSLESEALMQATDPSPEEQAISVVRVTEAVRELREC
jgi:hypothetical protein